MNRKDFVLVWGIKEGSDNPTIDIGRVAVYCNICANSFWGFHSCNTTLIF